MPAPTAPSPPVDPAARPPGPVSRRRNVPRLSALGGGERDDLATRRARGRPVYPLDEKLLAALAEGLPPCAGIALGVDRLAMMVLGATSISQVVAFTTAER